jgi:methyl-accepting chemotaxis protein
MVVICEECGLKYQIDLSKIKGVRARFKCKNCANPITVEKQEQINEDDLVALEEALLTGAPTQPDLQEVQTSGTETEEADGSQDVSSGIDTASTQQMAKQASTKRSGFGLTTKVILLMLLVSLLPGAIYFGLSFKQSNERIASETDKTGILVSGLLVTGVDDWIDKNVRALKALAKIPAITSMNQFEQEEILQSLQEEYPWMYLVFTTDERGMNIARNDGKALTDYSDRQYVKDVVAGADLAWQNLIGKTSQQPALVMAVPIKDGEKVIGVLASAMTRDDISRLVTNFSQGRTGSSFLVDEKGVAVAHKNNAYVLAEQNMTDHPLVKASKQGVEQRVEFADVDGKETIGFARKTKLGWALAIQQEKSEAFEALKKARIFAYSLLVGTLIVIVTIAYFASRAIVTPIRRLTDAANRISVGDLDVEIINTSTDEIGDLAEAIMRMQDSIRLSISRLKRRRR